MGVFKDLAVKVFITVLGIIMTLEIIWLNKSLHIYAFEYMAAILKLFLKRFNVTGNFP